MNTRPLTAFVTSSMLLGTVAATHVTAAQNVLSPAEKAAGWRLLFDGGTTDHWRGYRSDSFPAQGWIVEDDCLKVVAGGGGGDIITRDTFRNFELSVEFRVASGANSGIIYRVAETEDAPWKTGPEFQVLDDARWDVEPTNSHGVGGLYDLVGPPENKRTVPTGAFNHGRLIINEGVVQHHLNGMKLIEIDLDGAEWAELVQGSKFRPYEDFGKVENGHLCLQDHGNDVWFRNIKVRDLDAPMPGEIDLFADGLDGWNYYLKSGGQKADVWAMEDGVVRCVGNPVGYLKTKKTYDNFVLRLEWRWPDPDRPGNSGVLLRMHGEDKVWPKSVEAQLMHGSAGDFWNIGEYDMTADPARTNGRNTKKLAAAEKPAGEWNEYEIIVDGGSVVLYVNGIFVNRAWNVEELAGHICLQSEGAPIEFRNVRLAPIE
jgi:hypothetical protein